MNNCKVFLVLFLNLIAISVYCAAPLSHLDSLLKKCETMKEDSAKMGLLNQIAGLYNDLLYANDKALDAAEEALAIAQRNNYIDGQVWAYLNTGNYFQLKGDGDKALYNFLQAQDIAEKNNRQYILANVYSALSEFYWMVNINYTKALEFAKKDSALMKELGNKRGFAGALGNIANIYFSMDSSRMALQYYLEAADSLNTLYKKTNEDKGNIASTENDIGATYTALKEYNKALEYYQKSFEIYEELNFKDGIATYYGNIGNVYDMKGEPEKGVAYSEQALAMAREVNDRVLIQSVYIYLAEGYSKMGNYKKAFDYQTALLNLNDTLSKEASSKEVSDMQVKYDTDKKEKENQILSLNAKKQKIITYAILTGLVLVIALSFFIYRGYRDKQKANEALGEKNKIIEEINKDILDSINYAKRIQHAILTSDEYLTETLGEHFVLYKPRDVVSGDFYWCYANQAKVIFAVADCTGHGVPGAFMSMIGNSLLNEIVIENRLIDAAQILNALRANIVKTLQQKGQSIVTRDGMDIALCVWDKEKNEMQYSGANNSLYLYRDNGELEANKKLKLFDSNLYEILPDKQPIGFMEDKMDKPFSSYSFQLKKDDIIYISSDGYADQFGGEANKKFTKRRFRELLASIAVKPLPEQKEIMDRIIEQWKNNTTQTDDICLLGIKIS